MKRYVKCPACGARTAIEYGGRLREHHRFDGNLCPNYSLTLTDNRETFQDAVRNDPDMTPEQKARWLK